MSTETILEAHGRSADSRRWWWNDVSSRRGDLMRSSPRPLLLGYIRAQVLTSGVELPGVEQQLSAFADRENFSLGTVYVERGSAPGAFRAMLLELERDETAFGIVVPGLHHLTRSERQIVGAAQYGAGLRILVAHLGPRPA